MAKNYSYEPDLKIKSSEFYTKLEEIKKKYPNKKISLLDFGIIPPDFNVFIFEDKISFVECR